MRKTTCYGLATVGVVGSLLSSLILFGTTDSGDTKSMRVKQDFMAIQNALKTYVINVRRPPTTAQGLDAMVSEPKAGPKPRRWIQIMRKLPTDPWGMPYRYTLLAPREREWRWELRSAGRDGVFGNSDDLATEEESGDPLTLQNESVESHPSY